MLSQDESHEIFLKLHYGSTPPPVVFYAQNSQPNYNSKHHGRSPQSYRGGNSGGRKHVTRHPPDNQLCRQNIRYAEAYPTLYSYAKKALYPDANLVQEF